MKVYKIGDVSKICEISAASIRFFEEKGILHPQKDVVNNYRYYTVWDINRLLEYRKLRELGFSLNESIDIITGSGLQQFRKSLDMKIEEAEKLAAYYEIELSQPVRLYWLGKGSMHRS